ncbi:MAG: hypothetical protein NTW14_14705 [bacterium]|nr:hypothetical protein [bacterium]
MAEKVSVAEVAEKMYKMVKEAQGMRKLKAMDLTKNIMEIYGDRVDKQTCKDAIREIIETEKCVYTYFGGSYIELPHKEGAANP